MYLGTRLPYKYIYRFRGGKCCCSLTTKLISPPCTTFPLISFNICTSVQVSSSGSDSDVPAKRPRLAPRKSRARTKLSPLLENACSPIAKTDLPQPSPLAAARLAPQSIFSHQPRPMAAVPNFVPEITVHDVDHRTTSTVNEMTSHASNISSESLHAYRTYLSSSASSSSLQNLQISQAHSYPYFPPPDTHQFQFFSPHYYTHLPQKWGSSPVTSQWNRSGQIQSVPPWFIFANNRLEGKVGNVTTTMSYRPPIQDRMCHTSYIRVGLAQTVLTLFCYDVMGAKVGTKWRK